MGRPFASLVAGGLVLLAGGCGSSGAPLPGVCNEGPDAIVNALRRSPGAVMLRDGTRLSTCVERARSEGELQSLGISITQAADQLAHQAARSSRAASGLGFLIGAVERGGRHTNGIHAELVRRVQQDGSILDGGASRSLRELRLGLAAGLVRG